MSLLEVFGMSESSGAIAVCGPTDLLRSIGSCGRPLPLGQVNIADDGEILWRGANNMMGYKGLQVATNDALGPKSGQLHTGDIGKLDARGYLFITDRKKDLIITAGGENVAPAPIEATLLTLLGKSAVQVVLIGYQRKFLTILIAPAEDSSEKLEQSHVETCLNRYNVDYAKSRAQRIQKRMFC